MKIEQLRGVIIRNLLFLVMFFVIYFPLVSIAFYYKDTICGVDLFTTYCNNIPESTNTTMAFILYGLLPLGAIIWTIWSMSAPTYEEYR